MWELLCGVVSICVPLSYSPSPYVSFGQTVCCSKEGGGGGRRPSYPFLYGIQITRSVAAPNALLCSGLLWDSAYPTQLLSYPRPAHIPHPAWYTQIVRRGLTIWYSMVWDTPHTKEAARRICKNRYPNDMIWDTYINIQFTPIIWWQTAAAPYIVPPAQCMM